MDLNTIAEVLRPESADAVPFWRVGAHEATEERQRALLRLVRVAASREVIRRDWCAEDPILQTLPNLRMAAATNYPLSPEQTERLAVLWSRTGVDWTRDEAVAGLWAYAQTYGGPVSRLPDSPVATVALRIGRAVSGVYNKVMNFRHLDPRDERAGMSGGSDADARVWDQFFDKVHGELRRTELDKEFARLWGDEHDGAASADQQGADEALDRAARTLEPNTLSVLLSRYNREAESRPKHPRATAASTRVFERSALVVAIARLRANHRCEVPGCDHPVFTCADGGIYSEVHHIVPLGEGGEDTPSNVACVCPAHHREAHVGKRAREVEEVLKAVRMKDSDQTAST
jgi:predicted HNH restriction endonuclease